MTVGAALSAAERRLRDAGVDSPRLDARVLVAHVLGVEPAAVWVHPERPVAAAERAAIDAAVARRAAREPVARIVGAREFWSLPIGLGAATLVPRPDSETLIEAALDRCGGDRSARVLDLGTGSGCLLFALLSEWPRATGVGVDIDADALATAAATAAALGLADRVRFVRDDWGAGLPEAFDVVMSNPPYVPEAEIDALAPEVARFEPRRALSGGADGLDAYRALAGRLPRLLAPQGAAFLEVGAGQADAVAAVLGARGLATVGRRADLAGVVRCLDVVHGNV